MDFFKKAQKIDHFTGHSSRGFLSLPQLISNRCQLRSGGNDRAIELSLFINVLLGGCQILN
jgi:hypothetical protein